MSKVVVSLVFPATKKHSIAYVQRVARVVSWAYNTTIGVAILTVLIVVVQLAYPRGRTRPFLKISGGSYGFVSYDKLTMKLKALDDQTQTLKLSQKTYQTTAKRIGVNLDAKQITNQATDYSWKHRLIPYSLFSHGEDLTTSRTADDKKLDAFVHMLVAENTQPASNAKAVKKTDGTYELVPEKLGVKYEKAQLKKVLARLPVSERTTMEIAGSIVEPPITNEELRATVDEIKGLEKQTITIMFGGQKIQLAGTQIQAWASVLTDENLGTSNVAYDQPAIEAWLSTKAPLVKQTASPAMVYMLDGAQQQQVLGKTGQALDTTTTAQAIVDAAKQKKSEVTATIVAVGPAQRIIRSYSPTNAGLATLINDWRAERKSAQTAVYFQEIGGSNRAASANADASFFAASIYKLYVAYFLMNGIQNKSINPSEQVVNGKDIAGCVQAMIVVSNNTCPKILVNRFGWNNINALTVGKGLGAPSVARGNITVTARNVGEYLRLLNDGTLLDSSNTATLLSYMAGQKYRSGIPAGVPGVTVQDKVGFYRSTWHDAAIVHSQKANYILVILTKGSSPTAIADLARRIDSIL